MRTRFLAPLVTAMVLGLGVLGFLGLQAHHRSQYAAAEKQLQAIPLPAGVTVAGATSTGGVRFTCTGSPDRRCLHSAASASAVGPMFDRLLQATSDDCGTVASCQVTGWIAGRPAYLIVFPHLYVRHGHPYFRGSDMELGLVNP